MKKKHAIVLLSGGQDSTTCLYWAMANFEEVTALGFCYGQKHAIEQEQAKKIATQAGVLLYQIDVRGLLEGSSLTDKSIDHNAKHSKNKDLPASFTAGRNALFLTLAASWGFNRGIHDIVTGVCQTDYSGYPDCRRDFIDSMQESLSYAMDPLYTSFLDAAAIIDGQHEDKLFHIHTPLMYNNKAQTWKMANDLGILRIIIEETMTDYNGDTTMNEWGMGVDNNPATNLRVQGFYEAKERGWLSPTIPPTPDFYHD